MPKWYEGDPLPQQLIDSLPRVIDDESDDDIDKEDESECEDVGGSDSDSDQELYDVINL